VLKRVREWVLICCASLGWVQSTYQAEASRSKASKTKSKTHHLRYQAPSQPGEHGCIRLPRTVRCSHKRYAGNSKPVHEEQDDGDEDISLTPDDTRSHTPSHDTDSDTRPYVYKPDVTVPPVSVSVPIPVAAPSYPHTHSHSQQNAMHSPHLHRRAALEGQLLMPIVSLLLKSILCARA
jgi:hypothetical protein